MSDSTPRGLLWAALGERPRDLFLAVAAGLVYQLSYIAFPWFVSRGIDSGVVAGDQWSTSLWATKHSTLGRTLLKGDIALSGVSFGYDDENDVLRNISLTISDGEHVGIAGRTGSGKSTLTKVLCGLYAPNRGRVTVGDIDISEVDESELRSHLLLIGQDVHIVNGSIVDNITLWCDVTRDDISRAIEALGVSDWLLALPDGLDTVVGPAGIVLSSGQSQIIGLTRAVLLDPDVLVLDEATADMDPDTANRVESGVVRARQGRSLAVVAHRASTLAHMGRIVRLEDGRVVSRAGVAP